MAILERPFRRLGIRERVEAEPLAQVHRLPVGEHLIAGTDDADDLAGIGRNQGCLVRHPHIARYAVVSDGREDGGFIDGKNPVFSWGIAVHSG